MSSYRVDYDSWPWNGHREQAREDARYGRKDRDLYDPYDGDHKRAYAEEFNRETRRIEDARREKCEEEQRQEQLAHEHRGGSFDSGREDKEKNMKVCEECGSDGDCGMVAFSDGKFYHFRKMPEDGKVYPVWCSGNFVEQEEAPR